MTATIPLSRGMVARVSAEDLPMILAAASSWSVGESDGMLYAVARIDGRQVKMHRLIMGNPKGTKVDHRDGDGLNNQRTNLRACTNAQNTCNARVRCDSISGMKNIRWTGFYWRVRVKRGAFMVQRDIKRLEVARRYARMIRYILHGEFAIDRRPVS